MLVPGLLRMGTLRAAFLSVMLSATAFSWQAKPVAASPATPQTRVRVALALSGGGSLGLAHIGVLKYFEEHHIPIDAIAGSSMGGLIGGLYATGRSAAEIEAMLEHVDWDEMVRAQPRYQDLPIPARQERAFYPGDYALRLGAGFSLPSGLSTAEPLNLFLSREMLAYSAVEDFDQLPTPFRCVATQLETGEPYVLRRGNLARALRATVAVPGIFTPVQWEGHVLVDGGLVDNLPTDVARQMGADVVVAVHFDRPLPPARQLRSLPAVLTQAVSVAVANNERESLRNADLVLAPSLTGIGGIDFAHASELIERGYEAAARKQRFLATLALNDADWAAYVAARKSRMRPAPAEAARLVAQSSDHELARHAQAEFDRVSGPWTLDRIESELSKLTAAAALPGAFYAAPAAAPDTLIAHLEPSTGNQLILRPSLELAVANGDPTRATLNGFIVWLPKDVYRASYRVQLAAGYSPKLAAEYDRPIDFGQWFWSPSLRLERQNSETYDGSLHLTHWRDTYSAGLALGYGLGPRLRVRAGLEAGYEQLSAIEFPGALAAGNGAYLAPRLQADWNSLDEPSLPSRGTLFSGSMTGLYRRWDGRTVPLARGLLEQHVRLLSGTATASLNAASSFGTALNYFDLFPLGGPADLRAFRFEQFHASSYALGGLAYRHPFGGFRLFGERPQIGAWYEAAGLVQPLQAWQSEQSGSLGVLFRSPLGVVTFAIGRTSDGQTRGWINVGRP